jgi:hypothetical protein
VHVEDATACNPQLVAVLRLKHSVANWSEKSLVRDSHRWMPDHYSSRRSRVAQQQRAANRSAPEPSCSNPSCRIRCHLNAWAFRPKRCCPALKSNPKIQATLSLLLAELCIGIKRKSSKRPCPTFLKPQNKKGACHPHQSNVLLFRGRVNVAEKLLTP